ncbi:hypothetical protein ACLKA7_011913 [Drosophila subpalustris]
METGRERRKTGGVRVAEVNLCLDLRDLDTTTIDDDDGDGDGNDDVNCTTALQHHHHHHHIGKVHSANCRVHASNMHNDEEPLFATCGMLLVAAADVAAATVARNLLQIGV